MASSESKDTSTPQVTRTRADSKPAVAAGTNEGTSFTATKTADSTSGPQVPKAPGSQSASTAPPATTTAPTARTRQDPDASANHQTTAKNPTQTPITGTSTTVPPAATTTAPAAAATAAPATGQTASAAKIKSILRTDQQASTSAARSAQLPVDTQSNKGDVSLLYVASIKLDLHKYYR